MRILQAIERDQFDELPAKPFIRGFVISYCRFIGLEPKETLLRFGSFIDQRSQERPNRDAGHSGYAFERPEGEQSRVVLWAVLGGFMLFGGIAFIFLKPSLHHHHNSHVDKLRAAHGPSGEPSAEPSSEPSAQASLAASALPLVVETSPSPSVSPSQAIRAPEPSPSAEQSSPAPNPSTEVQSKAPISDPADPLNSGVKLKPSQIKHKLILRSSAHAWVRYQLDNRPMMKFVLKEGKVLVLRAESIVQFQISNPSAVSVNYNGRGDKALTDVRGLVHQENGATLCIATQPAECPKKIFPDEKPLPHTSAPNSSDASDESLPGR